MPDVLSFPRKTGLVIDCDRSRSKRAPANKAHIVQNPADDKKSPMFRNHVAFFNQDHPPTHTSYVVLPCRQRGQRKSCKCRIYCSLPDHRICPECHGFGSLDVGTAQKYTEIKLEDPRVHIRQIENHFIVPQHHINLDFSVA